MDAAAPNMLVHAAAPDGPEARAYDFGRPRAFTARDLRTAEAAHRDLAAALSDALSDALGEPVDVALAGLHEVLAQDFERSRALPTALFALGLGGADLRLDLAPALALLLVERHLGSADPLGADARALSDLERAVVERRWLPLVGVAFAEAWGAVPPRPTAFAPSPARLPLVPGPTVVADLEVTVGEGAARIAFAYPADTLRTLLAGAGRPARPEPTAVAGLPLLVRAELGRTRLPAGDVAALAPGDVIPIGRAPGAPVPVWVGDRLRFEARAGTRGARLAVEALTHPAPPDA